MPAFKVWCEKRLRKKCIPANSMNSLLAKVKDKFLLAEAQSIQLVLEEDGTEVDDDESLEAFHDKVLMVLGENEIWVSPNEKSPTTVASPGSPSVRLYSQVTSRSSSPSESSTLSTSESLSDSPHRSSDSFAPVCTPRRSHVNSGEKFQVPWNKLRTPLLMKLEKSIGREVEPEMKLLKTEINEIIRAVVPEIRMTSKYPGREVFRSIAETMIKKYLVLADLDAEGKKIGSGLGTIAIKMEEHNNYLNRPSKNASLLALISSPIGADGKRKRKRGKKSAQSGTVEWQPEYPEFEDETTQIEKKKWLISEARKSEKDRDAEKVLKFMESTYASQRLLLNSDSASVSDLQAEWPLLLESVHLFKHCERLVFGFHSDTNYWSSEKLKKIIFFMEEAITVEKAKAILEVNPELKVNKIKEADDGYRIVSAAKNSEVVGAVKLIMHKFGEKKGCKLLFVHKEEGTTRDEVLSAPRSPAPCVVIVGRSEYEGTTHYVVAENTIVSAHSKASDALTVAYCFMYLFNMRYPPQIGYTWEFLQRYMYRNDPEETQGSKNPKRRAAYISISPPVNSFMRHLGRFKVVEAVEEEEL